MNEETEILWDKAVFGKQVEEFLGSDIGKYLLSKADRELSQAIIALRDCTPDQLVRFQSDMKRAESIREWLVEAVEEGLRAMNLIEEIEE